MPWEEVVVVVVVVPVTPGTWGPQGWGARIRLGLRLEPGQLIDSG